MDPLSFAASTIDVSTQLSHVRQRLVDAPKDYRRLQFELERTLAAVNALVSVVEDNSIRTLRNDMLVVLSDTMINLSETLSRFDEFLLRTVDDWHRKPKSRLLVSTAIGKGEKERERLSEYLRRTTDLITLVFMQISSNSIAAQEKTVQSEDAPSVRLQPTTTYSEITSDNGESARRLKSLVKQMTARQRSFVEKLTFESAESKVVHLTLSKTFQCVNEDIEYHPLHPWLQNLTSRTTEPDQVSVKAGEGTQPTTHLVICDTRLGESRQTLPFTRNEFATIMRELHLPNDFVVDLLMGTPVFKRLITSHDRWSFVLRTPLAAANNYTLALTWDIPSATVYCILHGLCDNDNNPFRDRLQDFRPLAAHPIALPVLICELLTEADASEVKRHASNLYAVELRTNTLRLDNLPKKGNSADDNLEDLTRRINAVISRLAFHEMRLKSCANMVESITEHLKNVSIASSSTYNEDIWALIEPKLRDSLSALRATHEALLIEIDGNQTIAKSQLQSLYNLSAQRDNRNNLEMASTSTRIARITQEDSFAMRTIAIMTITFLPATAVSSIFSMTMFNWSAGASDQTVVSHYFWIYWVVAIPLTLIVVGMYVAWLRINSNRGREEAEPSRKPGAFHTFMHKKEAEAPDELEIIPPDTGDGKGNRVQVDDVEKATSQNEEPSPLALGVADGNCIRSDGAPPKPPKRVDTFVQGPLR